MNESDFRILLIEDDEGDAILVERTLQRCQRQFTLEHANCLEDALACLADSDFDAVLLDLSLSDSFGLSALERIRKLVPDVPIVVLTGLSDDDLALQALEQGAQDYLVKGSATAELLERTIRYAAQRQQIQAENRRLLNQMAELARQDPLTGVLNRHSFAESLHREWKLAERHERPLACVVLDLDFFKRINDTFGHAAGDRALKKVAETLCLSSRTSDYVGRLGGEEFCVLLPETSEEIACGWAERVRQEIAAARVPGERDELQVTVSLGVASRRSDSPKPEVLIDNADEAMFIAKQLGRDQVVSFSRVRQLDPLERSQVFEGITVKELMRPVGISLTPGQSISEAVRVMQSHQAEVIPVLGSDGELRGVIAEDDIISAALTSDTLESSVGDLMQTQQMTYAPDTAIREVCEFLCRAAIRQVFVVEGNQPLGMISRKNVLQWLGQSGGLNVPADCALST